jgi:hypothetical protein
LLIILKKSLRLANFKDGSTADRWSYHGNGLFISSEFLGNRLVRLIEERAHALIWESLMYNVSLICRWNVPAANILIWIFKVKDYWRRGARFHKDNLLLMLLDEFCLVLLISSSLSFTT